MSQWGNGREEAWDAVQETELTRAYFRRMQWEFEQQAVAVLNAYARATNPKYRASKVPSHVMARQLQTMKTTSGVPWLNLRTTDDGNSS